MSECKHLSALMWPNAQGYEYVSWCPSCGAVKATETADIPENTWVQSATNEELRKENVALEAQITRLLTGEMIESDCIAPDMTVHLDPWARVHALKEHTEFLERLIMQARENFRDMAAVEIFGRCRTETAGGSMSTEQQVQTLIGEPGFEEAKTFTIFAAPYPHGEYGWVILLQEDKIPIRSGRKFKTEERAADEMLRVLRYLKGVRA